MKKRKRNPMLSSAKRAKDKRVMELVQRGVPVGLAESIARKASAKKVSKKRAVKKKTRKARCSNPAPLLYIITAQGTGKKMHLNGAGTKFTEEASIRLFKTADEAYKTAANMVSKFPMLRKYRIAVETNQHRPGK